MKKIRKYNDLDKTWENVMLVDGLKTICCVQEGTVDEWVIDGQIEGDVTSDNLVVLVHSGGEDRHERGRYITYDDNNKPIKKMMPDGSLKTIWNDMGENNGNYDIIADELKGDACIFRFDLRNHGDSLRESNNDREEGSYDKRPITFKRLSKDLDDVINNVMGENGDNFKNIYLVGTCFGSLTCVYWMTSSDSKHRDKVRGYLCSSPLNPYALSDEDADHVGNFNSNKNRNIREGNGEYVFNGMRGVFEGIDTYREALENVHTDSQVGIGERFGKFIKDNDIPVMYVYSLNDRILPPYLTRKFLYEICISSGNIEEVVLSNELAGDIYGVKNALCDHCFWNPEASKLYLSYAVPFMKKVIGKTYTK